MLRFASRSSQAGSHRPSRRRTVTAIFGFHWFITVMGDRRLTQLVASRCIVSHGFTIRAAPCRAEDGRLPYYPFPWLAVALHLAQGISSRLAGLGLLARKQVRICAHRQFNGLMTHDRLNGLHLNAGGSELLRAAQLKERFRQCVARKPSPCRLTPRRQDAKDRRGGQALRLCGFA